MQPDDTNNSKKETDFSTSYSHLPPHEIFVYDQEEPDTPFEAAATPAHENLTTKTTDITEPDIPSAPRTKNFGEKRFTFDQVSPPSQSKDDRDAVEAGSENGKNEGESAHGSDNLLRESADVSPFAVSEQKQKGTQRESRVFFEVDDSVPSDEERATTVANAAQLEVGEQSKKQSATDKDKLSETICKSKLKKEAENSLPVGSGSIGAKEGTIADPEDKTSCEKQTNDTTDSNGAIEKAETDPIECGVPTQKCTPRSDSSIMPAPSDELNQQESTKMNQQESTEMNQQESTREKTDSASSMLFGDDICLQLESLCLSKLLPS